MLGIASVAARDLVGARSHRRRRVVHRALAGRIQGAARGAEGARPVARPAHRAGRRSEEHTSELQSRVDLVCRLLLEKKKINEITARREESTITRSAEIESTVW